MKINTLAAFAAMGFALSGCASIVEGTTQSLAVTTPPADGAKCVLTSSEGTYYVTSPGNAIVHKTKNDLSIVCNKDGFNEAHFTLSPHFNGATAGNILAGGIIGIGIDAATGANYNYPPSVAVPMTELAAPATPPTPADAPPAKPADATPTKPSS